tara:strand:- start:596 stop:1237 length:642 start_codon:yes stop_codon:yes gene_type:complete
MNPLKNLGIVKRTINTLITLSAFSLIGCSDGSNPLSGWEIPALEEDPYENIYDWPEDTTESEDTLSSIVLSLLLDLELDGNGFYHLPIDTTKWQTLHRLTGLVTRDSIGMNVTKVSWYSNHYWLIGDTLGYMIQNTGSDDLWYVGYDTTYITWFNGFEVPIVNSSSYSDMHGEVNTMIAPVKTMRGDTISIGYSYFDDWKLEETIGEFSIVLD